MRRAKYICFEGTEGVGKTTQAKKLASHLTEKGYKVLLTKEPGTPHSSLTMKLREIMLSSEFDKELTVPARELISQAIRSIHYESVIFPALRTHDFIIQDRGVVSGLAYGQACGNSNEFLWGLSRHILSNVNRRLDPVRLYDAIIYLRGNVSNNLTRAQGAKQEFEAGDAIEAKGNKFMEEVADEMDWYANEAAFPMYRVDIDDKGVDDVFQHILATLGLVIEQKE